MQLKNLHTEKLFPYVFFAPYKIQNKFYNFHGNETIQRFYNHYGNSSFMGLLFYNNRVMCYNIVLYAADESRNDRFLDVTDVFNELLKEFNIFHLCYLFHRATFKFNRENALTENILHFIRYQNDSQYKPKFTYAVTKHRGRFRLFIENNINENQGEWNRILLSAIRKDSYCSELRKYYKERPNLFTSLYSVLPKVNTASYEHDSTQSLRKSIKARRKRVRRTIQRRRLSRRSNSNT